MKLLCDLQTVKRAIRDKYAWPGGYPLYLVTLEGDALSIDAARKNWRSICDAHIKKENFFYKEWQIAGVQINYEDAQLYCCETNERIESAYAEDDAAM